MDAPSFELPPTQGIKVFLNEGGSISLSQYDPYFDDEPNIVVIEAHQVDAIIGWLQYLQDFIAGQNYVMG